MHLECGDTSFSFIYGLINLLRPNSVELCTSVYSGPTHLGFFHSLSKLSFESVVIHQDCIPLYSLYRFLRSTRLTVFKFNLQFHFLSALYDDNNTEAKYDFNLMDKTDGLDINEDYQVYCIDDRCGSSRESIPEYSRSLWKECLQLLKTNTTLTELSIGHHQCEHGGDTLNQQLIYDLLDSLSNNKSIKTLYLDFLELDEYLGELTQQPPIINADFISSLLQNNTTIESLYIGSEQNDWDKPSLDDIVNSKPPSSKCFIGYAPNIGMSYHFSSKAYQ